MMRPRYDTRRNPICTHMPRTAIARLWRIVACGGLGAVMAGNEYKPKLPNLSKYRKHGRRVNAKAKYKAVMQEIAYCHDTGTRFDNQTCADMTGHSIDSVKRVLDVLERANVIKILNPGTKARQVKLRDHWLEFWRCRSPQVAAHYDGKLADDAPDWREAKAKAKAKREAEAKTANRCSTAPDEPVQTAPHKEYMGHARVNGTSQDSAQRRDFAASDAPEIEAGPDLEAVPWWEL